VSTLFFKKILARRKRRVLPSPTKALQKTGDFCWLFAESPDMEDQLTQA
jgi:hypothetical protein